jgi:hypothetical protein
MLNQNYSAVGKRNCRIALGMYFNFNLLRALIFFLKGPYSNPLCYVAESFRCIVLVDAKKIDFTDPPFLNRFEKQSFSYLLSSNVTANTI